MEYKNQKGFAPIILLFVVALVIVGGSFYYFNNNKDMGGILPIDSVSESNTLPIPKITSVNPQNTKLDLDNTLIVITGNNLIDARGDQVVALKDSQGNIYFISSVANHNSDGTHSISFNPNAALCSKPWSQKPPFCDIEKYLTPGKYKLYVTTHDYGIENQNSNEIEIELLGKY